MSKFWICFSIFWVFYGMIHLAFSEDFVVFYAMLIVCHLFFIGFWLVKE